MTRLIKTLFAPNGHIRARVFACVVESVALGTRVAQHRLHDPFGRPGRNQERRAAEGRNTRD